MPSVTLNSSEVTTQHILMYIYDVLKIQNVEYISCTKKQNYGYNEKGKNEYQHYLSPVNGTYECDKVQITIEDLIINNKQICVNCSKKDFQIIKKIVLTSSNIDDIFSFIEVASKFFMDSIKQDQITNEEKLIVKTCEKYGMFNTDLIPKRNKNTVFFKKNQLDEITSDILKFLEKDSHLEYINHGVPYKLNILLHGSPGVGKTTLIHHLATICNAVIYVLNINSDMSEMDFLNVLRITNEEDRTVFIIIEDIDCIFEPRKINDNHRNNITMQGILNALDGFNNKEGGIIIMTTNYPDKLDSALTRSGRIDINIELTNIDRYQAENMYNSFFDNKDDFDKIWNVIKEHNVPPCAFHDFLFKNRKSTSGLFEKIEKFIASLTHNINNSLYM